MTQIGNTTLAASWSELGRVSLWNLNEELRSLESPSLLSAYKKKYEKPETAAKPIFTFKGHLSEGYGLDWCQTEPGTLATADCKGNIHIWRCGDHGGSQNWHVDQRPYSSHAPHSVEDLQWSPNERNVLASCSVDKRYLSIELFYLFHGEHFYSYIYIYSSLSIERISHIFMFALQNFQCKNMGH